MDNFIWDVLGGCVMFFVFYSPFLLGLFLGIVLAERRHDIKMEKRFNFFDIL